MTKTILSIMAFSLLLVETVLPMNIQTDRLAHWRELLVQDVWAYGVHLSPRNVIESHILMFRETGEVSERIVDDTGPKDESGSWQLEESGEQVILVLTGENLRNKGRFTLKEVTKDKVIEFQRVGTDRSMRFERVKGFRPPDKKQG